MSELFLFDIAVAYDVIFDGRPMEEKMVGDDKQYACRQKSKITR